MFVFDHRYTQLPTWRYGLIHHCKISQKLIHDCNLWSLLALTFYFGVMYKLSTQTVKTFAGEVFIVLLFASSCRSFSGERSGERTVKRLRLCKALTVPDSTTLYEACRRMAARRVDALLLTDSNALLCGILTDRVKLSSPVSLQTVSGFVLISIGLNRSINPLFLLKDIATRVIAKELNLEETPVSKVMTKNPVFVLSDTIAVEALQKMVQGL